MIQTLVSWTLADLGCPDLRLTRSDLAAGLVFAACLFVGWLLWGMA